MAGLSIRAASAAGLVLALLPAPSGALEPQLPNLKPRPPRGIRLALPDPGTFGTALRFSVTTQNLGEHPFELLGAPPRPDLQRTAAQQCTAWAARACLERREVGDFTFHAEHGHWHIEDYALYELRRLDTLGNPDLSPDGLAATAGKISFCLLDFERAPEAAPAPNVGPVSTSPRLYLTCQGVLQGISPGWADTYHSGLPGQQIIVAGVPDGRYAIVVTVDPDAKLLETTRDDNVAFQRVELFEGGSRVRTLP